MQALTVIQPWAHGIIHLGKPIENRDWPPPRDLIGARFAVHAGKSLDRPALRVVQRLCGGQPKPEDIQLSGIIGTVELAGYLLRTSGAREGSTGRDEWASATLEPLSDAFFDAYMASPWRDKSAKCLWLLRDPVPLKLIPCRGFQKLWTVRPPVPVPPSLELMRLAEGSLVDVRLDDGTVRRTRTRSEPWQLPGGRFTVLLEGISGGYKLDRCTPVAEAG